MPIEHWPDARNILCVRLDTLGDVLMTEPALRALKQAAPGRQTERRITLLTSAAGAKVAALLPEVDEVVSYAAPWMKSTPFVDNSAQDRRFLGWLRARKFDAAVIFTVFSQNPLPAATLCYLADIPLRLAHCRENPYQLLTHWVRETEPHEGIRHEVRRQLDLVASVGCECDNEAIQVCVPGQARAQAAAMLAQVGIDANDRWLVIHPGASAASRRYPAELFAAVADGLVQRGGWQIVFTGSAAERELVESIRGQMSAPAVAFGMALPVVSLAGMLDLPQLAGLLSLAPVLVSNNTGPVHLAAAVGTPVVDLYALTNPQHTPWQVAHRVLFHEVDCKYCYQSICPQQHHDCLRKVQPERVVAATLELLAETVQVRRLARPQLSGALACLKKPTIGA